MKTMTKKEFASWCTGRMSYSEAVEYFQNKKRKLDGVYYYTCEFQVINETPIYVITYVDKCGDNVQIGGKFASAKSEGIDLYVDIFKKVYNEDPFNVNF